MRTREVEKLYRQVLTDAARRLLGAGATTSAQVADAVIQGHPELLRNLGEMLIVKGVHRDATQLMKKMSEPDKSKAGRIFGDLKGLPKALSFEIGPQVYFITRGSALRRHFQGNLSYLRRLMDADLAKYRVLDRANERLEALRRKYGDKTESELIAMEFGER